MNDRGKGITQGLRDKTMVFTSRQMKTSLRKMLLDFRGFIYGTNTATTNSTDTWNESSYKLDESCRVSRKVSNDESPYKLGESLEGMSQEW